MPVLRSSDEILDSVRAAERRGLCAVPDRRKAWDNVWALETIETARVARDAPVADLGCRSGILLTWLHQLGYRRLYGCDLQRPLPPLRSALVRRHAATAFHGAAMYVRNRRRMRVAPVERTGFPSGAFGTVASMSVVEHGVDTPRFFAEAARLLRAGGVLVVSTDYWPEEVETRDLRRFAGLHGRDRVFARPDVERLVEEAAAAGLELEGDLDLDVETPVIEEEGLRYTFLALAWRRR